LILFCDTSALVKLYLQEDSSEVMQAAAESAAALAVCRIAWAEMMAALARRGRENPADSAVIEAVRTRLRNDWDDYVVMEITQSLVELAGDYADTFALRGYDSVQLAAARLLHEASGEELQFACFRRALEQSRQGAGAAAVSQLAIFREIPRTLVRPLPNSESR
jgi:uncharacterized protein